MKSFSTAFCLSLLVFGLAACGSPGAGPSGLVPDASQIGRRPMDTHGGIATGPTHAAVPACNPTLTPGDTHGGIATSSTSRSTKDTHGGIAGAKPATTTCPTPPVRKGDDGNDGNQNSDQGNND